MMILNETGLQTLFRHWCIAGEEIMDSSQFRSFARDRNFISSSFTETELFSVFQKIQDEEGAMLASAGGLQLHHKEPKRMTKKKRDEMMEKKQSTSNAMKDGTEDMSSKETVGVEAVAEADKGGAVGMGQLNDEMTFSEFCEALAAIAVYKDPDPYLPLHQKLEQFIFANVLGGKVSNDD